MDAKRQRSTYTGHFTRFRKEDGRTGYANAANDEVRQLDTRKSDIKLQYWEP